MPTVKPEPGKELMHQKSVPTKSALPYVVNPTQDAEGNEIEGEPLVMGANPQPTSSNPTTQDGQSTIVATKPSRSSSRASSACFRTNRREKYRFWSVIVSRSVIVTRESGRRRRKKTSRKRKENRKNRENGDSRDHKQGINRYEMVGIVV